MTHDELLAKIENNEADMCSLIVMDDDKCEPIHGIYDALRAVVELHKPTSSEGKYCSVCCEMDGVCDCCTGFEKVCVEYPCPTIQAIEKELK